MSTEKKDKIIPPPPRLIGSLERAIGNDIPIEEVPSIIDIARKSTKGFDVKLAQRMQPILKAKIEKQINDLEQ